MFSLAFLFAATKKSIDTGLHQFTPSLAGAFMNTVVRSPNAS